MLAVVVVVVLAQSLRVRAELAAVARVEQLLALTEHQVQQTQAAVAVAATMPMVALAAPAS
jgi:hypothetical protein